MALAFRSISTINLQTASLLVPKPAGMQENDFVVYGVARNTTGADTITASDSGWTNLDQLEGTNVNCLVGTRIASSSEPANYTFTAPSSRGLAAFVAAYSGADIAAAVSASGTNVPGGTAGTSTPPSIVVGDDGSLHLVIMAGNGDFGTITPAASYTVRGQDFFTTQQIGIFLADASKNIADSPTGTQNFTHTALAGRTFISLMLKPGAGGVVHNPLAMMNRGRRIFLPSLFLGR